MAAVQFQIPGNKLITSWDQRTSGNPNAYKDQNKNGFISSTDYPNWPINATSQGAVNHTYLSEVYVNLFLRDNGINIVSNKTLNFKNAIFTIKDTTTFTMNSGSILKMDAGSKFRTFQTNGLKTITVGNSVFINMTEGSAIHLNKTKFQLATGATDWKGIELTNTLLDTIKGCEFNGTDTCISVYNSNKCWARNKKMIIANTFNSGEVLLRNVFQCLITGNYFALNYYAHGLEISNIVHPIDFIMCDEEESSSPPFALNIVKNYFSGGAGELGGGQLYIHCAASDLTPFYISDNEFQGTNDENGHGIITIKASGDIKNNKFTSDDYDFSMRMYESEINLLGNEFLSSNWNAFFLESTSIVMAPLYSNMQYYWYGGRNDLNAATENIYFADGSDVFLNNGFNCLTAGADQISADLPSSSDYCIGESPFPATKNYWSPFEPISDIRCPESVIDLLYTPYNSECETTPDNIEDYEIIDRGDEIIDSILITGEGDQVGDRINNDHLRAGGKINNSGREDEELLTQSLLARNRKNYNDAIYKLKNLIDNYDTSKFISKAVGELYMNYLLKDTGINQSNTTTLFNNLEAYLENKIEEYESNFSFVQKAYSYYLMCLTKTLDYNEAILGYENIMENHPDFERQLLASWDRAANVLLQQGSGGADNLTDKDRLEKLYKDKPVHLIVKNVFKKIPASSNTRNSKFHRENNYNLSHKITKFNPETRNELDSKVGADLEYLLGLSKTGNQQVENIIPTEYKLHQNYPNPFNPKTIISFDLPNDEFVELKIYDIAGKELMTLVSEHKTAGNYSITFDGNILSSGAYFYKLKSGKFEMVRKMMLIK